MNFRSEVASHETGLSQCRKEQQLGYNLMPLNREYTQISTQPEMRNEGLKYIPYSPSIHLTGKSQTSSNNGHAVAGNSTESLQPLVVGSAVQKSHYHLSRYIPRTLLNIFGPIFILLFYIFIIKYYLQKPSVNNIIPKRPIDGKIVFYAWWLINIFILDWAKSGIAGYEAAALMNPAIAPNNARQLMWHADRNWGSLTGWGKAIMITGHYIFQKVVIGKQAKWIGPCALWFHLACSSLLLYIAIPLSGLSLNQESALQNGNRRIEIAGVNQSTFDLRAANALGEQIAGSWRQGGSTAPQGASILYAPDGTLEVSDLYFEDRVQDVYQTLLQNTSNPVNESVTIFSGPQVSERAYGRVWGFMASVACTPVHPYTGLKLFNMSAIDKWSYRSVTGGLFRANTTLTDGLTALATGSSQTLGVNYKYMLATNDDISGIILEYSNRTRREPSYTGIAEIVVWQAYDTKRGNFPDQTFKDFATHPMVVNSTASDNLTYAGFAVSCSAASAVGHASLSAATKTFSDFALAPSTPRTGLLLSNMIPHYPGVMRMTSLAFAAMGNVLIGYLGNSSCDEVFSTVCSPWAAANAATHGVPVISETNKNFQLPTISPERMTLAMYKLLGQVAVTVMGVGPGNWTCCDPGNGTSPDLGIFGLDKANDVVPGVVPYQAVLVFLGLWVAVTVLPQLYPPFFSRRWSEILDGFAMFRLGAEWREAVHNLEGVELVSTGAVSALDRVPGMIGDINPSGKGLVGFVGLSRRRLSTSRDKTYTYN